MMTDADWIQAERRHELQMAEIASKERRDRRRNATERITNVTIGLTIVLVVGIVALLFWRLTVNSTDANTERDRICAESGGTRAAINGGGVVCIHIGETEPG